MNREQFKSGFSQAAQLKIAEDAFKALHPEYVAAQHKAAADNLRRTVNYQDYRISKLIKRFSA